MQIFVSNKQATLKKDDSFEYVSENRLFSSSDDFSLTITFPLRDCEENIAIFGHINRADVAANNAIFDCEIRDRNFFKSGSIAITEISESEVKAQFLEGRSAQNYDTTFDTIYVNELKLGAPEILDPELIEPSQCWNMDGTKCDYVALPWVNDTTSSANIQNLVKYVIDDEVQNKGHYEWVKDKITGLSWQPYLLYITKKICEEIGYTPDFSAWEAKEELRYLIVCNTIPAPWDMPEFNKALPNWSVKEYFEKLELFLGCEFDFNHKAQTISCVFTNDLINAKNMVMIEDVIDEYSSEISVDDDNCDYIDAKNLEYKECDNEMWKYYSCNWFIKANKDNIVHFATVREILDYLRPQFKEYWFGLHKEQPDVDKVYHAMDCDAYFIIKAVSREDLVGGTGELDNYGKPIMYYKGIYQYKCILIPINLLGARVVNNDENAKSEEIEFVPAYIDETEDKYGKCLFLSHSEYEDDNEEEEEKGAFAQPNTFQLLCAGEKDKTAEFYDRIYVAWWDGANLKRGKLPCPLVENIEIGEDWETIRFHHFSLRINDRNIGYGNIKYKVLTHQKSTFKFIADTIPDVRSLFIIKGKRYICEKINATFTDNGLSNLMKGTFWPVIES